MVARKSVELSERVRVPLATHMKTLVLAGGRGTRLWPLSRKHKPKQFQKLISEKTMLQETVSRLFPLFGWKDIFISTNKQYVKEVRTELSELPKENVIAEPVSRERVASLALFLAMIKNKEFDQPLLVLPSDHLIKKKKEFQEAILTGERFIKENPSYIIILGATPSFPDTGLGYIKKGRLLTQIKNRKIYKVAFFKEKPNLKRAKAYLKSKNYFWSTGIYIFIPSLMKELIEKFVPDNYKRYQRIQKAIEKGDFKKVLEKEYPKMDSVSLEYTIIENYKNVALIPVNMGWSDVGSWTVLKNCLSSPEKSFIKGNYIGIDSENVMVYGSSNNLVAGIGIKDLIIAYTDDIILICHKDKSQKVKEVIKKIEKQKQFDYL